MTKRVKINCLTDCAACCCKSSELTFPFSDEEAIFLEKNSSKIVKINSAIGPLYKLIKCAFLKGNLCLIHNKPSQPKCCKETKPGSSSCEYARKCFNNKPG